MAHYRFHLGLPAIDDSGYSPAQCVLARRLRLPYTLLDLTGRFSLHEGVTRDRTCSERIAMMSVAQRSITSLRYDRASSRAVLARSRAHGADAARDLLQVGDVMHHLEWAAQWHGPRDGQWFATRLFCFSMIEDASDVAPHRQ